MQHCLPKDFRKATGIVIRALGPPPPPGDGTDFGDFRMLACHRFVSLAGIGHANLALDYFARMTRHVSAEFDIRPFILRDQGNVMRLMLEWTRNDDWRVRRLASEGARPRLPWGLRLTGLVADPRPLLPILEALRDDPVEAVRRSVANNLNDIAKDHPDLVVRTLKPWTRPADGQSDGRQKLVRHALRHLVKQGHAGALALMGVDPAADLRVTGFRLGAAQVAIGDSIGIEAVLENAGDAAARAIVDYALHHPGARGGSRPKVFKWTSFILEDGEEIVLRRSHSTKPVTTRRTLPGRHKIDIRVNGQVLAEKEFDLCEAPKSGTSPRRGTGNEPFSSHY
jgi:3-methyladenine DNA glycosylase AlkC